MKLVDRYPLWDRLMFNWGRSKTWFYYVPNRGYYA